MATFTERMIGAAKLDVPICEEVEADTTALGQAMTVVVLSSVAAGIGTIGQKGVIGLVGGNLAALIAWFIWAFATYLIGTKLLPETQTRSDMGELLRTTGFSSAPGLLRIFGLVPILGGLIVFVADIWMLVAMVIAVRQALDYNSTWRAIGVCFVGWLMLLVVSVVLLGIFH
jgi:Yip1 domain